MVLTADEQGQITQFVIKGIADLTEKADHAIAVHKFNDILDTFGWKKVEEIVNCVYSKDDLIIETIMEVLTSREIMTNFTIPANLQVKS